MMQRWDHDQAQHAPSWWFAAVLLVAMIIGGTCETHADDLAALRKERRDDIATGVITMTIGAVGLGVGALVPFGGPEVTITPSDFGGVSIDYSEETLNGLNYVLIAGGAALVVVGGLVISSAPSIPAVEQSAILPSIVNEAPGVVAVARW